MSNDVFDGEEADDGIRETRDLTGRVPGTERYEMASKEAMKDGVSSDATSSKRLFINAADTISDRAKNLKIYASEVGEKLSEKYLEIETRLKAYVGTIDDAEEHTIDNLYITRGYRINHNTCRSIFKSLFSCHNEFVNIWSHIIGVLVFLVLLTAVWSEVLPNQFWYAYTLIHEFK